MFCYSCCRVSGDSTGKEMRLCEFSFDRCLCSSVTGPWQLLDTWSACFLSYSIIGLVLTRERERAQYNCSMLKLVVYRQPRDALCGRGVGRSGQRHLWRRRRLQFPRSRWVFRIHRSPTQQNVYRLTNPSFRNTAKRLQTHQATDHKQYSLRFSQTIFH